VTVLLFTWFTYSNENPGIIFIAMNYSVHAVMYTYYWLAIVKRVPDWFPTWLITLAQIAQMVRPPLPLCFSPSLPCSPTPYLLNRSALLRRCRATAMSRTVSVGRC